MLAYKLDSVRDSAIHWIILDEVFKREKQHLKHDERESKFAFTLVLSPCYFLQWMTDLKTELSLTTSDDFSSFFFKVKHTKQFFVIPKEDPKTTISTKL